METLLGRELEAFGCGECSRTGTLRSVPVVFVVGGFIEGSRPPSGCLLLNAKCFFLLLCDEVARLLPVCLLSDKVLPEV